MADKQSLTNAPQSTLTSPPNPPYTPRSTSIADDSETEFEPTPVHSPGGPQYEDLPPSYDFALSDARNGVASLDASQVEAHRVTANEGPNEPEVWEYRMRDEANGQDDVDEHEEAPAYDGHVPVQHVASSTNIPVGRVGDVHTSFSSGNRGAGDPEDPPHSIPESEVRSDPPFNPDWSNGPSQHYGFGGRGARRGGPWTPFGPQAHGPFAPGQGPFGRGGRGPFGGGRGRGLFGRGRGGGACRSTGPRSGSSQDWAAFGQNLGKMGEEFGRRMGNWGEQFGRQAGAMGEQFGRQAGAMGQQLGRDVSARASSYSGRAQSTQTAGPSNASAGGPPGYDEPPSYQGPAGTAEQETGVLPSSRGPNDYPPEKVSERAPEPPSEKHVSISKQKADDYDYDSDSDSSISSSSSSSSSSDEDDHDTPQSTYLARLSSIHRTFEAGITKGKKSLPELTAERDLALQRAMLEREEAEARVMRKQTRRTQKRDFKTRRRELKREYRARKRELRGKGKGKGKEKKGREWKEIKREFRERRKALKRERGEAKKAWKLERDGMVGGRKGKGLSEKN
ncbi:hypothetical protein N0V94_005558 [Neodidymelliopsis sp. IMI 364377]|nr:hypothetical protein N0V94_005558 [Neodidymelliopsis sp. IMI 364377]